MSGPRRTGRSGGSFLGAHVWSDERRGTAAAPPAASHTSRGPEQSAGVASVPAAGRFLGTIRFDNRWFGWTLATGQSIDGTVTGWSTGFQIWLFARAENTDV